MSRAIRLRSDFTATELRGLARRSRDGAQARRLLALAAIYNGDTRSQAALLGNVTLGRLLGVNFQRRLTGLAMLGAYGLIPNVGDWGWLIGAGAGAALYRALAVPVVPAVALSAGE